MHDGHETRRPLAVKLRRLVKVRERTIAALALIKTLTSSSLLEPPVFVTLLYAEPLMHQISKT